jgi:death-on-curing family protein
MHHLESALLQAQNAAHYQLANVVEQAELLIAGIAFAHVFLDGNKRTAVVAGGAFLDRNGFRITAIDDEFGRQIEALVRHAGRQADATQQFLIWLANNRSTITIIIWTLDTSSRRLYTHLCLRFLDISESAR